jgi:hypothetical protein
VTRDGNAVPVYSAVVDTPRRRRVVLAAHWVETVGVVLLVVALFCLPDLLLWLIDSLLGGVA